MNVRTATAERYDVSECARCGGAHPGLSLRPIGKPSVVTDRGRLYILGSWFLCPVTSEPAFVTDEK